MGAEPRDQIASGARDARALLERGVAAGVITADQRDALLALLALPADVGAPAPPRESQRDSSRGALDPVVVAYTLGAALVVFALGWFLADRWRTLGPAGVLGVALGYAALFAAVAARLARARFPLAAGVATALATLTAPLVAWALLRLTGEWPEISRGLDPLFNYEPYMATRRLVLWLAHVLAALLCVRLVPNEGPPRGRRGVRRTPVAIPLAAALPLALSDVTTLVSVAAAGFDQLDQMRPWAYATAGALAFGVAYETDRRQPLPGDPAREDFAAWLYLGACLAFEIGWLGLFDDSRWTSHALPLVALAMLAAAVRLRRRVLLVFGLGNAIWYLGWLAFDVFDDVLSFPILLAAFGVSVIVLTVFVQRRFPALVRRDPSAPVRRATLPGGSLAAWAPALLAFALLAVAAPQARREVERIERERREARVRAGSRTPPSPPARSRPAR